MPPRRTRSPLTPSIISASLLVTTLWLPVATAEPLAILGGERATQAETYGTVVLVTEDADGFLEPFCTGTLIAPDLVLTATHCVVEIDEESDEVLGLSDASSMLVGVGVVDAIEGQEGEFYEVDELIPNPGFPNSDYVPVDETGLGQENDIALIWLTEEVVGVEPIPILPPDLVPEAMAPGNPVIITGYGLTDENDDDSAGVLHIAEVSIDGVAQWEFTVGGGGEVDSCQGDSGGPGYVEWEGELYLVGASSRGVENSDRSCGDGGIYTLVPAYLGWMADVTNGDFDPEDIGPSPSSGGGGGGGGGCSFVQSSGVGAPGTLLGLLMSIIGLGVLRRGRS